MEINEYVRTKDGKIGKYIQPELGKPSITNGISFNEGANYGKHSKDIIDLIEVGDYVNGMRVKNIMSVGTSQYVIKKGDGKYVCCGDYGLMDDGSGRSCYALQWNNNQIEEVLTHEQYEANCYKVVE